MIALLIAMLTIAPMATEVVEVNYDTDTVVCMDRTGNEWGFYGCEDWIVGDYAMLTTYCDKVVKTQYVGYNGCICESCQNFFSMTETEWKYAYMRERR